MQNNKNKIKDKLSRILLIGLSTIIIGIASPNYVNAETISYYDYLTKDQKKIYNKIKDNLLTFNNPKYILNTTANNDQRAIDALLSDFPEYFVGAVNLNYTCSISGHSRFNGNSDNWLITYSNNFENNKKNINKGVKVKYKISGFNNKANVDRINDEIDSIQVYGNNDYEKIKFIHDYIINRTSYNYNDMENPNNTSVSGVLLNNLAVCEGYARTFKLLCDREGIPCILVSGVGNPYNSSTNPVSDNSGHMWNYVRLNGRWYAVDATWDDVPGLGPIYDYFLVGANTRDSFDIRFSNSHLADSEHHTFPSMNNKSKGFRIPPLSPNSYFEDNNIPKLENGVYQ